MNLLCFCVSFSVIFVSLSVSFSYSIHICKLHQCIKGRYNYTSQECCCVLVFGKGGIKISVHICMVTFTKLSTLWRLAVPGTFTHPPPTKTFCSSPFGVFPPPPPPHTPQFKILAPPLCKESKCELNGEQPKGNVTTVLILKLVCSIRSVPDTQLIYLTTIAHKKKSRTQHNRLGSTEISYSTFSCKILIANITFSFHINTKYFLAKKMQNYMYIDVFHNYATW